MFLPKESTRTPFCHRGDRLIITARWEKGRGRHFFCQIKDNFPMPYFTVVEGCQAGGLGHLLKYVYARVQCRDRAAKGSTLN